MGSPTLRALLAALAVQFPVPVTTSAEPTADPRAVSYLIFLVDFSSSMAPLEDITQALITHYVQLAELSGDRVRIAVIFFGGNNEVIVIGDQDRMPTSAYQTLRQELLQHWPKLSGATPLDSAMGEAVRIVTALPAASSVSLILFTDGQPDSGVLRPEAFPEVQAEFDRRVKAIEERYRAFPPATIQNQAAKYVTAVQTPGTEEFSELYALQRPAEFQKTLEHATAIHKAGVRFITVDYGGDATELAAIHTAGGGKTPDRLLAVPASTALAKLHALNLTALPGVLVQNPVPFPAEPTKFDQAYDIALDTVGDKWLVTLLFDQRIPADDRQARLEIVIAGTAAPLTTRHDDPSRFLSVDSAGRIVAAHVLLDAAPADRHIAIRYTSPQGSMTVPAATLYVHLRLPEDLELELRPQHLPEDATPPFRISPSHQAAWRLALRSRQAAKVYPLKSAEPVLINVHDHVEVRLGAKPDPQVANAWVTDATRIARGTYDARVTVILDSGAVLTVELKAHVESRLNDEWVALDITQPAVGRQLQHASHARGHVDFGEVGDTTSTVTVEAAVRTIGLEYPVQVHVSFENLVDSANTSPHGDWLRLKPTTVLLQPGRAERLLITLKLPELIEEDVIDGPFQGTLNFTRLDLGETMPVRRLTPIAGIADDEPPDQVTFRLHRPQLTVRAPRCFRDAIATHIDGRSILDLPISIDRPFARSVSIQVGHDGIEPRQVTVHASPIFVDADGKQAPWVRLTSADTGNLTRELSRGASGDWILRLEVDGDEPLSDLKGTLTVSSPGLKPLHVDVLVAPRRPPLGPIVRFLLRVLASLATVSAVVALARFVRARRLSCNKEIVLTDYSPLAGILTLDTASHKRPTLMTHAPLRYSFHDDTRTRPLGENHSVPIALDRITPETPLILKERTDDDREGWKLELTDFQPDPPELHGRVLEAPRQMEAAALNRSRIIRRVFIAIAFALLAHFLAQQNVLAAAQWLYELMSFA